MHNDATINKLRHETIVCIPVLNEVDTIGSVITNLRDHGYSHILVGIDAATNDGTDAILASMKVPYVRSTKSGYDPSLITAYNQALIQPAGQRA